MNRLRTITLSLLMLALVAGGLPVTDTLAKWGRPAAVKRKKNSKKKRRSRAWWRRYRARVRARRERAMQRRPRPLSEPRQSASAASNTSLLSSSPGALAAAAPVEASRRQSQRAAAARLPFEFTTPYNWGAPRRNAAGDVVFSVRSPEGRAAGLAVLAPVSLKAADFANATQAAKTKTVGGAPVAALRRTVIDRMVAEGGWVVNDVVQEIRGRRVFVVVAQTGAPGAPTTSWTFYFTELDGRVYSLATTSPLELSAPVAAASEQFMASLRAASDANSAQK